ncbi:MAG: hypothetical protein ACLQDY_24265 [Streptosporangiaceae bacterium]
MTAVSVPPMQRKETAATSPPVRGLRPRDAVRGTIPAELPLAEPLTGHNLVALRLAPSLQPGS